MIALTRLPRRALTGALGAAVAGMASASTDTPEGVLTGILLALEATEDRIATLDRMDDRTGILATLDHQDTLLARAAFTQPDTPRGFAIKARIAQLYAENSRTGTMVARYLLADLMVRGGMVA